MSQETKICVVGLGYVGLPLACLLSKKYEVFGYDHGQEKISELKKGFDRTGEIEDLSSCRIEYSASPEIIKKANFIIVAVPTPINEDKKPDLSMVKSASVTVGRNLAAGAVIVYESTVYPGCTEEICSPILEEESGLKLGAGFKLGYSPERVNPGDKKHTIDKIVKVVSGSDESALEKIAEVYGSITNIHKASSIKVAEAAKVIENVQRDLNIALVNELAVIFDKLGISTKEVLAAAGTKWNFHKYQPGLVGGHCIGVDPYYLTYKAQELGYEPKIILAGRELNEGMVDFVAEKLSDRKKVLILGVTFKENVPDFRNSKAYNLMIKLKEQGCTVRGYDPLVDKKHYPEEFIKEKGFFIDAFTHFDVIKKFSPGEKFDGIIVFSPHDEFKRGEFSPVVNLEVLKEICSENPVLFDLKGFYDKSEAQKLGFKYLTL